MNVRARSFLATAFVALSAAAAAQQPERIDTELNAKIREEGLDRSKIMWIEHYLTDVYGPRPIGSPNHVAGESESQVRGGAVVAVYERHGDR